MQITTDSGTSLEVEPTQTKPLPPSTPEVQGIPAGGFTPGQVIALEEAAAANPPITPVHDVPQLVPPGVIPGGDGGNGNPANPYTPLSGAAAVDQLYASADLYGIDVLASAANAIHEGAGGGIGDGGTAFGPWQIHAEDGRLSQFDHEPLFSPIVQAWAWSSAGFDYAHRSMRAGGAGGKTGHAAVSAIVTGFERPADESGAIKTRTAEYDHLKSLGNGVRAYLIKAFGGPDIVGTTVTGVGSVVVVPSSAPYTPSGVNSSWSALMRSVNGTPASRRASIAGLNSQVISLLKTKPKG